MLRLLQNTLVGIWNDLGHGEDHSALGRVLATKEKTPPADGGRGPRAYGLTTESEW